MKKRHLAALVCVLVAAFASPSGAITMGQPDGNGHPYVGALVANIGDNGEPDLLCSGTLISPRVFLTAGHCTDYLRANGIPRHDVWVTFDPTFDSASPLLRGRYHTHPDYGYSGPGGFSDPHDIAVVVLDSAASPQPARLPHLNELGTRNGNNSALRDQLFTAVGYGIARDTKTSGPNAFYFDGVRRRVDQSFENLRSIWLKLNMNPSTGSGGTCYGDSGGPHFLKGTRKIVSITITGDTACRSTDLTYRLDTRSARAFLDDFVTLP